MYTYLIKALCSESLIKIGKTKDIRRRISELQTSSPSELLLVALSNLDCESKLHREFGACRVRGEWFSLSDGDVKFLVKMW